MSASDTFKELLRLLTLACQVVRLPVARLRFDRGLDPAEIEATYRNFTRPHPRYKLIPNKAMGMAVLDLEAFASSADYAASLRKKDYAAYHAKRAQARGYQLAEIDRNAYVDDIHLINTSAAIRQGRPMDATYHDKKLDYQDRDYFKYFGVLNKQGKLVAYCNVAIFGNFASTDQLLGYKNNDGVMYFLILKIACRLIDEGRLHYFMYDTFLGARPGLRNFKKKLGFRPYRVRYSVK
ncbi:MAG TPA: hypothetical protein VFG03_08065 [Telluria sp.]|nr:hypothetical protein [Telluria sp.]